MRLIFALTIMFGAVPFPSLANDGFGALGVGGLIIGKTDQVALAKEVLDVGCNLITVNYDFVNESDKDVTSLVVFPLPPYPATPHESGVISHGQPFGFKVEVNGQPVNFETKVRATLDGKDVTDTLRSAGFSDKQIASFPFDTSLLDDMHRLQVPESQIKALKDAKLLDERGPAWDIHVDYEWMQTFPAKATLHVMHSYQPFVAEGTASGYEKPDPGIIKTMHSWGRDVPTDFCLTKAQRNKLDSLLEDQKHLDAYSQVSGSMVDYILMTANTWKDGIRNFDLRIHADADDEVVASCYPKGLRKVAPDTYEVNIKNFKPKKDLKLYLGNTAQCMPSNYGLVPQFK